MRPTPRVPLPRGLWTLIPLTAILTACSTPFDPFASSSSPSTATSTAKLARSSRSTQPTPNPKPYAPPMQSVTPTEPDGLRSLVWQQDRLYRVAAPLLVNNAPLCKSHARHLLGFTAKNKFSYSAEFVEDAERIFKLSDQLQIMGVLPGSGAARAGVRRGDKLIAIEENPIPQGQDAERQAAALLAPLVSGRNQVNITLARDESIFTLTIPLTKACAFSIELGNANHINAYSDGRRILVTRGMLSFTRTEEELAYVLAKEMAHNTLLHASKQRTSATVGGIIDNLTRVRPDLSTLNGTAGIPPMPKELDAAADNLALYLLARAGYRLDSVIPFWQRLATQYSATVLNSYTALHPSTDYRIEAMEKTLWTIKTKQANNAALMP